MLGLLRVCVSLGSSSNTTRHKSSCMPAPLLGLGPGWMHTPCALFAPLAHHPHTAWCDEPPLRLADRSQSAVPRVQRRVLSTPPFRGLCCPRACPPYWAVGRPNSRHHWRRVRGHSQASPKPHKRRPVAIRPCLCGTNTNAAAGCCNAQGAHGVWTHHMLLLAAAWFRRHQPTNRQKQPKQRQPLAAYPAT